MTDHSANRPGVAIEARALSYRPSPLRGWIIPACSLSIPPGECHALLGPSGAGKTTLLRLLAGQARPTSGRLLYNGWDLDGHLTAWRPYVGYVPQHDQLHLGLTVRASLAITARLCLPQTDRRARRGRVADVLDELELTPLRRRRIRTLSGGQRKRVAIAAELLASPPVLFLDEPTSGLDPGLDRALLRLLGRLAGAGTTILLTTHQTEHLDLVDRITFLGRGGRHLYTGPAKAAAPALGARYFRDLYSMPPSRPPIILPPVDSHPAQAAPRPPTPPRPPDFAPGSPLGQWAALTSRQARLLLAEPLTTLLLLLQAPLIGALLLLVAPRDSFLAGHPEHGVQTVLLLTLAMLWLATAHAGRVIATQRPILAREISRGARPWPMTLALFTVQTALVLSQAAILLALLATHVPLPNQGLHWPARAELLCTLTLTGLAGAAAGLLISARARTSERAGNLVPLVLLAQVMFSGGIFAVPGPHGIVSWPDPARWALGALGASVHLNDLACPSGEHLGCAPGWPQDLFAVTGQPFLAWAILLLLIILLLGCTAHDLQTA